MNREGFWSTGKESDLPQAYAYKVSVDTWKGKEEFLNRLDRIQSTYAQVLYYKGISSCRICNCMNGSREYKYEGWQWPEGYSHYIEKHNVRPSLAFEEFITGKIIT